MEQTFKIKFSLLGIEKIANVKASTRAEAEEKLYKSLIQQVKILTVDSKEPDGYKPSKEIIDKLPKEFTDMFYDIFGKKR